jgi:hypothetical protein
MDPANPYALAHRVPLEDLPAGTRIHYRAVATTRSGVTYRSDAASFETLPVDADASPTAAMSNVALLAAGSRVLAVSSNFADADNGGAWGADAVLDGQMATEWSTNGDGDEAFVEIDLGRERDLLAVAYRSRRMSDGSSIVTRYRLVLGDGSVLGPFSAPDPNLRYEVLLDAPVRASRVRFEAVETSGGNTGGREIELFEAADAR